VPIIQLSNYVIDLARLGSITYCWIEINLISESFWFVATYLNEYQGKGLYSELQDNEIWFKSDQSLSKQLTKTRYNLG
jgi:hypothetical protein